MNTRYHLGTFDGYLIISTSKVIFFHTITIYISSLLYLAPGVIVTENYIKGGPSDETGVGFYTQFS